MNERTNYAKVWADMQRQADEMGYGDIVRAMGPEVPDRRNDLT